MILNGWQEIDAGGLGEGVVLDAEILWALRAAGDPEHTLVKERVRLLAGDGLPLIVPYLSLAEAMRHTHLEYGPAEAYELLLDTREILNVLEPRSEDLAAAEDVLAQGAERLTLEQAVAGAMARRLGCAVYGHSPAYHLFRVPVIMT